MADIRDRMRELAAKQMQEIQSKADASTKAQMDAESTKKLIAEKADGFWSDFASQFRRGGQALKDEFPNDQISVYDPVK